MDNSLAKMLAFALYHKGMGSNQALRCLRNWGYKGSALRFHVMWMDMRGSREQPRSESIGDKDYPEVKTINQV